AKGARSIPHVAPTAGRVPEIRYSRFARSAHAECTSIVLWPDPSTVSTRVRASSAAPSSAPCSGVDGSYRLLITRIVADVTLFHGPVYRSVSARRQVAHAIMSNTAIRPQYGTRWSSDAPYCV